MGRPHDWGDEFPSDTGDSAPTSPTTGMTEFDEPDIARFNKDFPLEVVNPDEYIDPQPEPIPDSSEDTRDAHTVVIVQENGTYDDGETSGDEQAPTYDCIMPTGELVKGVAADVDSERCLRPGDQGVLITGGSTPLLFAQKYYKEISFQSYTADDAALSWSGVSHADIVSGGGSRFGVTAPNTIKIQQGGIYHIAFSFNVDVTHNTGCIDNIGGLDTADIPTGTIDSGEVLGLDSSGCLVLGSDPDAGAGCQDLAVCGHYDDLDNSDGNVTIDASDWTGRMIWHALTTSGWFPDKHEVATTVVWSGCTSDTQIYSFQGGTYLQMWIKGSDGSLFIKNTLSVNKDVWYRADATAHWAAGS